MAIFKKTFLIISLSTLLTILAVFCFAYLPRDAFALGIKIGGESIGGLSRAEAKQKIEMAIDKFSENNISFSFQNNEEIHQKKIDTQNIKISFNIDKSLNKSFSIGKKGLNLEGCYQNLKEKIETLQGKHNSSLEIDLPIEELDEFITKNFGQFETLPQNSEINFNEKTLDFEISQHKEGMLFNRKKIKDVIKKDASNIKTDDIYLSLEKTAPEIDMEKAKTAVEKAKEIIKSGPYLLITNNKVFSIKGKRLGNWFIFSLQKENNETTFTPAIDKESIKNYLTEIEASINIQPKNPTLEFKEGSLKIISPPKTGKTLDIEKSLEEIQEKILAKENKISLVITKAEPKITEKTIKELCIEIMIGSGTSNFAGSPKNRIHNIKTATAKINGTLIGPNEEFSFNDILGRVGPAEDFLPELVIKKGKTVPEYGGGICQDSTTMFRVAVNSGMKILERRAHAYPVKYYSPQGFDATVYSPSPNFRFKNNTDGYILIQAKIENNDLTFEIYGKDNGRKVIIKGPYQYDFQEDGAMKARLYQEVWQNGKLILKDTFLSSYKSPDLYPVE